MLIYLFSVLILSVIIFIYFKIADHYNIIDKPNQRSSHTQITIRGGGIIFPIAVLTWFITTGFQQPLILAALMLMAIISFWDDISSLSPKIRIILHLLAVSILFYQTHTFNIPWYIVFLAYILIIGWINAFNFMDGINGITAFYSLVILGTMGFLNHHQKFAPEKLIEICLISLLIFTFFNARKKAKTFAGDVGSVSMAFIIAWLMLLLIQTTGRVEYILFGAVYGIDSIYTILIRLLKRENIFKAHRTHLYQYLANELSYPHVFVSGIYAAIQLIINIVVITFINEQLMNISMMLIILAVLLTTYIMLRRIAISKIRIS